MAVNNETGIVQPWREALALCREAGVPFFCDAAQWIGKLPATGLGACDWLSGCAHKFGGPQGVGFLKCSGPVRPLLTGGPQEEGRRAGTENVAGVLAMLAALEAREEAMPGLAERMQWRDAFVHRLSGVRVLGAHHERLWNTVSAVIPATEGCARWVVKLDKHGAAVSTGSACASGKEQISHVLAAMGLASDEASRVIRFSSGWETSAEEWEQLSGIIERAGAELEPADSRG
jgi:cysteine desulfurase